MTLHLIKLCVGCDSVEDLVEWIDWRLADLKRRRKKPEHAHVTRMVPKRMGELLDGGSLYWVIKGSVQARQRLLGIEPFIDEEGIDRCRLVRETLDNPAITTDVIVGFPGETDADFAATLRVARECGFSKIHNFAFSPRKGTPAATMPLSAERREISVMFLSLVRRRCFVSPVLSLPMLSLIVVTSVRRRQSPLS